MALPQQLKTARMSDATIGNTIDNKFGEFESALADILGITVDVDVTTSAFTFNNAGQITKPLVAQRAAGPVGWRFRDTTSNKEMRVCVNGSNLDCDENTGSEAVPVWANRFRMAISTGQLTGLAFSSARMGLAPQGDGNAAHFLDGTGAYSAPVGTAFPSCRVRHSSNQSRATGAFGALAFDTEDFDTDTMHDTAVNNSRIKFTTAGKYRIIGQASWDVNTAGMRELTIRKGGLTDLAISRVNSPASGNCTHQVSTLYNFSAGEYVELYARQTSGSTLNVIAASSYTPVFSAYRVG